MIPQAGLRTSESKGTRGDIDISCFGRQDPDPADQYIAGDWVELSSRANSVQGPLEQATIKTPRRIPEKLHSSGLEQSSYAYKLVRVIRKAVRVSKKLACEVRFHCRDCHAISDVTKYIFGQRLRSTGKSFGSLGNYLVIILSYYLFYNVKVIFWPICTAFYKVPLLNKNVVLYLPCYAVHNRLSRKK